MRGQDLRDGWRWIERQSSDYMYILGIRRAKKRAPLLSSHDHQQINII